MKNKLISVVGLGYIGLPTAALLASQGYTVVGTDISQHAVDTINQGKIHIVEPDLDAFVRSAVTAGRLKASTLPQAGDVYMICVPTPFHEGGAIPQPNIDYVLAATRSIAPFVKPGDLVILESTSPVGTTEKMQAVLSEAGVKVEEVHMAYCPERVLPGKIMTELVENDRVVGGVTPAATKVVADFYRTFVRGEVLETEAKTAEMCKLTENSFRDVNIAFANELSLICDKERINVWNLIQLANRHPRVNILQPSAGVGGHCIAVDPWFIVARDVENAKLIRTAREVNNRKTDWVIDKIKIAAADATAKSGKKPTIACLGLAFKPDIDDLRESPALHVALALQSQGYDVIAVEPNIDSHDSFTVVGLEQALGSADVIAVLVRHRQFFAPDVQKQLSSKAALDFCGALGSS
ncbi:UDP-N-acetyl-D-mannosamine dehydrogenase [Polynucleobacter sp. MWH-Spelu-300-X4]|uniref:UDP-N-acetyl-D-mannosamine dehydrogenase n=1 Tax=Polynucleobacter sp. MWH-Spelu-300-X4 TaxID=2689109 RepID=UPI001BFD894C|nr:UDP-N-acetyl-D-mannosamine dehydrogenase [Polynucleobacter sp. MWH-Spelu-300-X4]QWD80054.1 UDP-N-acetyl-D-mannosamine dehydrogenase [Polynucleobacter sp. MWH-Spelu-300-X4]